MRGVDLGRMEGSITAGTPLAAGLGRRAIGFVIDVAGYYLLVCAATLVILLQRVEGTPLEMSGLGELARVFGIWVFLAPLLLFALRDLPGGRSLGKWVAGTRVVQGIGPRGEKSEAWRLLLRQVPLLTVAAIPLEMLVVLGSMAAGGSWWGKRIGDMLAGTVVVEDGTSAGWLQKFVRVGTGALVLLATWATLQVAATGLERHSVEYGVAAEFVQGNTELTQLLGAGVKPQGFQVRRWMLDVRLTQVGMAVKGEKGLAGVELWLEGAKAEETIDWKVVAGFYREKGQEQPRELKEGMVQPSAQVAELLDKVRKSRAIEVPEPQPEEAKP